MNVIKGYPPNYKEIEVVLHPSDDYMFTYGDDIYWPKGIPIREDVMVHEKVHARRQQSVWNFMSPNRWWKKYLKDKKFRFEEELAAFREQWFYVQLYVADREMRNKLVNEMARNLSSASYGHIVSFTDALMRIKS